MDEDQVFDVLKEERLRSCEFVSPFGINSKTWGVRRISFYYRENEFQRLHVFRSKGKS